MKRFTVFYRDKRKTFSAISAMHTRHYFTGVKMCIRDRYSIHDFRITDGENHKNLIFDLLVPAGMSEEEKRRLTQTVCKKLQEVNPIFRAVIHVDTSFI